MLFHQRDGKRNAAHAADEHEQDDHAGRDRVETPGYAGGHAHGTDGRDCLKQGVYRFQGLQGAENDCGGDGQAQVQEENVRRLFHRAVRNAAAEHAGPSAAANAGYAGQQKHRQGGRLYAAGGGAWRAAHEHE